jgi:hypothetical protein
MSTPENTIVYDIDDPADARTYIATFGPRLLGRRVTFVDTVSLDGQRRRIEFATMTDADACFVARELWDMEQRARRGPRA